MTTKIFECTECQARGKIILKSEERLEDIVYCPVCSADIYEEDDYEDPREGSYIPDYFSLLLC